METFEPRSVKANGASLLVNMCAICAIFARQLLYMYVYVQMYGYTYMYVCVCVCVYIYICAHVYIYIYIYIYMYVFATERYGDLCAEERESERRVLARELPEIV